MKIDPLALSLRPLVRAALASLGAPTRAALARAVGYPLANLSAWLAGRRPLPLPVAERLLSELNIEPELRAELARLRGEIERAEARVRELVG